MKNRLYKSIPIFALATLFAYPASAHAQLGFIFDLGAMVLQPLGYAILGLTSLITMLSGILLNGAIYYTIVEMATNFSRIEVIDEAWGAVRDVANMGFIFVLLWASIELIIGRGKDTRKLIVNIIIAAILINFSLFFTKFAIDIFNLLALTFYSAIVPDAVLTSGTGISLTEAGLSNAIMSSLGVTGIFASGLGLDGAGTLFTITILSSVVLLITAFIFFAMAIFLVIRYVILIFVLILSPIAFVSGVLPGLSDVATKWKNALVGQGLFAPVFFLLMWVTVKVANGIKFPGGSNFAAAFGAGEANLFNSDAIIVLLNFIVIIGFLIFSLITAKKFADMAPGGVSKLTKWAMGAAGGASFGLAGRVGRGTLGRGAQLIAENEALKNAAPTSRLARLALAGAKKTSGASFDARAAGPGSALDAGKAGGKGGFTQFKKDKAEAEKKFAESLKPSDEAIDQAEQAVKKASDENEKRTAQIRLDQLKGVDDKRAKEMIKEQKGASYEPTKEEIEAVKKANKSAGDTRKEAYASTLEKNWFARARGYAKAGAATIRKSKSTKDKFAEAAKAMAKEEADKEASASSTTSASGGTPPSTPPPSGTPPTP